MKFKVVYENRREERVTVSIVAESEPQALEDFYRRWAHSDATRVIRCVAQQEPQAT
jgi:hypothetical protein